MQTGTSLSPQYQVRLATAEDTATLVSLINAAFLVEKPIIDGDRINAEKLAALFATGKFLLLEENSQLASCVYIEIKNPLRGYLGLLAVEPSRQKSGLGRKMIEAAEDFLRDAGCEFADLRIVNARAELQPIYERLGYSFAGIAPIPDTVPLKIPSHFTVMSKQLAKH
jgi:GNAT superfamily N-acetyltransferase